MAVSLKEFIRTALVDITTGVSEAKDECAFAVGGTGDMKDAGLSFQKVDFEVYVAVESGLQGNADARVEGELKVPFLSVLEGSFNLDAEASRKKSDAHRVSFSVPVWFHKSTKSKGV